MTLFSKKAGIMVVVRVMGLSGKAKRLRLPGIPAVMDLIRMDGGLFVVEEIVWNIDDHAEVIVELLCRASDDGGEG